MSEREPGGAGQREEGRVRFKYFASVFGLVEISPGQMKLSTEIPTG